MKEETILLEKLENCCKGSDLITRNKICFVYLRKLLILRREARFIRVEIFIYLMRMILLISNLKLVGHTYLGPILVSIAGLLQAITVVFKSMRSKKNFCKLEIEDLKKFDDNDESTVK